MKARMGGWWWLTIVVAMLLCSGTVWAGAQKEAQAKVQLEFYTWSWVDPQSKKYHEDFRDAFNALHPDMNLTINGVQAGEYDQKLMVLLSAGDAPDVFLLRPTMVHQLIHMGLLAPLDRWLADAKWKSDLLPPQVGATSGGKNYALIFTSTPQALVYNKQILQQAGVRVPTSVDECYQAAEKIYSSTGNFGYGCVTDLTQSLHVNIEARRWVIGMGSDFAKNDYPTANDPLTVQAIGYYKRFYDAEFSPKGKINHDLDQLMWEGKLGMQIEGAWVFGGIMAKNPDILPNIDAAMPFTKYPIVGGAYWGMSSGAANKNAAWEIMDLYNQREWQEKYVSMTAQIPAQGGMVTDKVRAQHSWWAVFDDAAKVARGYGYMAPGFELVAGEYNNEIAIAIADIFEGGANLQERLDQLQATLVKKFVK